MTVNSKRKDIAPSFFATDVFIDTSLDSIRGSRAFRVIHALEVLVRKEENTVLEELNGLAIGVKISKESADALGAEAMDVFCRGYSHRASNDGVVLDGVQGVVDEVLNFDEHQGYSVSSSRFQEVFKNAVMKRPKNASVVMRALRTFKELAPEDFRALRVDMNFDVADLSVMGKGAMAHVRLLDKGNLRVIPAAEEMLAIGFDPDTLKEQLEP